MEDRIVIGQIVKPQGIKGELKIKPLTDDAGRFMDLESVYIGNRQYRILDVRVSDFVYIALSGVPDRNAAETLRGEYLSVDRDDAVPLEEGSFFIVDVLGSDLISEDGEKIGVVKDIRQGGKDIYTIDLPDGKEMMFPLLKEILIRIDVLEKKVVIRAEKLKEVAVYED